MFDKEEKMNSVSKMSEILTSRFVPIKLLKSTQNFVFLPFEGQTFYVYSTEIFVLNLINIENLLKIFS